MALSDSENSFYTASSSYSESEYESDSTSDGRNVPQIQPYMFEPKRAVADREMASAEDSEGDDDRLGNLDWYVQQVTFSRRMPHGGGGYFILLLYGVCPLCGVIFTAGFRKTAKR